MCSLNSFRSVENTEIEDSSELLPTLIHYTGLICHIIDLCSAAVGMDFDHLFMFCCHFGKGGINYSFSYWAANYFDQEFLCCKIGTQM